MGEAGDKINVHDDQQCRMVYQKWLQINVEIPVLRLHVLNPKACVSLINF